MGAAVVGLRPLLHQEEKTVVQYQTLKAEAVVPALFQGFIRRQVVTKCWRKEQGQWVIRDAPFLDDWTEEDYAVLISCLRHTLQTGGVVFAAFQDGVLKGFASVESELFGGEQRYLDLSSLHVSQDMRGKGIGSQLFGMARAWAREHGAAKLYISPIRRWRASGFTGKWAVWRQRFTTRAMWRRSRLTASWNAQ